MVRRQGAWHPSWRLAVLALAVGTVAVAAPLLGTAAAFAVQVPSPATGGTFSSSLSRVSVTWAGKNISSAGQPSSAFSLSGSATADVYYLVSQAPASAAISNASLQVFYLGIIITTSKASMQAYPGGPVGTSDASINFSFGPLIDALEGVFQFKASLLYANGSTAWSESFYVFVKAPYLLASGAVVVLLVLTVAELYWGASAIREARRTSQPPKGGVAPPTGGAPPPSSSTAPPGGATGPEGTAGTAPETAPPPGAGSGGPGGGSS